MCRRPTRRATTRPWTTQWWTTRWWTTTRLVPTRGLTDAEQRADARRLYRGTVDHTYDVARIEAGQEGQTGAQEAPQGATARKETPAQDAEQEEGSRDAAAREPDAEGRAADVPDAEVPDAEVPDAEVPEAEETGARNAWAEALPALRAAWEGHEEKYPEPGRAAPSSQADGGWLADGGRRLTLESLEAKELTHGAYERIRSTATPAERSELEKFQRQVNERLDTPPGTAEIRDFPEKR
jgi:hypothetical protein